MFWNYTVEIMEKRQNNKIYWCYGKTFHSIKKAYQEACKVLDKMTGEPTGISIYKDFHELTIPTKVFEWGTPSFHEVDFYL